MSARQHAPGANRGSQSLPLGPIACPEKAAAGRIPLYGRVLLAVLSLGMFSALGLACYLQPDPYGTGIGTHEQLGLPPCGFRQLFSVRCPSCGMTTSWAYLMHGRPLAALRSNSGGVVLCVMALLAAPWMLISALRGRWVIAIPSDAWLVLGLGTFVVVTITDWLVRLLW